MKLVHVLSLAAIVTCMTSTGYAKIKDPCVKAARKAVAAHFRAQDSFKNFDPRHPGSAVIRSITIEPEDAGGAFTVEVEYGLPGDEHVDVAKISSCFVETEKSSCKVLEVSCDVQ